MLRTTGTSFILLLSACGPDGAEEPSDDALRFASVVCESAEFCGCAVEFSSTAECEDAYVERFEDVLSRGTNVMDECLEPLLDSLVDDPCAVSLQEAETVCVSLRGDRGVGESCSLHGDLPLTFVNECEDGLSCFLGKCVAPGSPLPPVLSEGDSCWSESPNSCGNILLTCGTDGTCHLLAELGSSCEPSGCQRPDLYCDGARIDVTGTCAAKLELGAACDPIDADPCLRDADPAHCDPATLTCIAGAMPLCDAVNTPAAWR